MFPFMIGSKKYRHGATADILGCFLKINDISGIYNLKLDGIMAEILAQIYPYPYRKYITTDEKV